MKWLNLGTETFEKANECKEWLDKNGIITGEIFDNHGIWEVPYMPIGSKQKELCEKQIEEWFTSNMF